MTDRDKEISGLKICIDMCNEVIVAAKGVIDTQLIVIAHAATSKARYQEILMELGDGQNVEKGNL